MTFSLFREQIVAWVPLACKESAFAGLSCYGANFHS